MSTYKVVELQHSDEQSSWTLVREGPHVGYQSFPRYPTEEEAKAAKRRWEKASAEDRIQRL
jgi:hypothetical protein